MVDSTADTPPPTLTDAPPSRGWIVRATFEAALIVLGLVGAVLVDEWRDARDREARVRAALSSIRAELEADRRELASAIANHDEVIARLHESAQTGTVYQKGVIAPRTFSSVAWEAARNAAITNDIDHSTLLTLGHAYTALDDYIDTRTVFLNYLYTNNVVDLRRNPLGLAGWLNDIVGRARSVDERLRAALRVLPG